jgi:hypothetical protein
MLPPLPYIASGASGQTQKWNALSIEENNKIVK